MSSSITPPSPQFSYVPPPRKRSRTWIWLVVILVPAGLLLCVAFVIGIGAVYVLTAKEEPASQSERQLVVDAAAVAAARGDFTPRAELETCKKIRYLDRSFDIEYEYDSPEDDDNPYINSSLTVERNLRDARTSYLSLWGGARLGMRFGSGTEVTVVERNDLFRWGDESRFALLQVGGFSGGNLFVARKDTKVVYLLLAGASLDEPGEIAALLGPVLERVEQFKP
jgi:hypothetical protein